MQQHAIRDRAERLLQCAGVTDKIGDIRTFRLQPPSGRTADWILSDLVRDAEGGQARGEVGPYPAGSGRQAPADEGYSLKVFLGSGDRGVYGFSIARRGRLPSSLLFVLDAATLDLKVQRSLFSTVVVLSGGPDGDVVLRAKRLGRERAAPGIGAIRSLLSAAAPPEA